MHLSWDFQALPFFFSSFYKKHFLVLIMESGDLHCHLQQHEDHHHQQQQQNHHHHHVGVDPSSSSSSKTYGVHENNHHSWTPNTILSSETLGGTRTRNQRNEIILDPSFNSPITQHMGFNWTNPQIPEGKQEPPLLNHDYQKFTDLLISPSSVEDLRLGPSSYMIKKNDNQQEEAGGNEYLSELSQKLMRRTLSSSSSSHMMMMMMMCGSNRPQVGDDYGGACGAASRENHITQIIHPSINISSLNIDRQSSSPSGIMSMSSFDFLNNPSRSISHDGDNNLGLISDSSSNNFHSHDYGRDRMSALSSSKTSEAKRPVDAKGPCPTKKSRIESRASCPPIKVRKEKLGERIAALQQLVAPFGKTDTASVLMEAIGYIKFLQNQIQALSVPYMKHSRSEAINRSMHTVSKDDGNEKPKRDLRSRGLCLVPLSCMSYVMANDNGGGGGGGGIWPPPPNFTQGR